MEKQLKDLSVVEIKAFILDEIDKITIAQNNIQILRQELERKKAEEHKAAMNNDIVATVPGV